MAAAANYNRGILFLLQLEKQVDMVSLRTICDKLSFLNADTDRNRKGTVVYLLWVNLLRMCL